MTAAPRNYVFESNPTTIRNDGDWENPGADVVEWDDRYYEQGKVPAVRCDDAGRPVPDTVANAVIALVNDHIDDATCGAPACTETVGAWISDGEDVDGAPTLPTIGWSFTVAVEDVSGDVWFCCEECAHEWRLPEAVAP